MKPVHECMFDFTGRCSVCGKRVEPDTEQYTTITTTTGPAESPIDRIADELRSLRVSVDALAGTMWAVSLTTVVGIAAGISITLFLLKR